MEENKKPKITIKNIMNFIEGNTLLFGDKLGLLPKHTKEQVEYRASKCYESCYKGNKGSCLECGCSVPGKWYVEESCNPDKFPDLMNEEDWENFKAEKIKELLDANND